MIRIDIPMPENCLACPFGPTDEESPFFDVWCTLLKRMVAEYETKKRQEDCPIKQVRHGRWVPLYDDVWECSECEQAEQFAENIESTSRYCPNCGARMYGGTEDDG